MWVGEAEFYPKFVLFVCFVALHPSQQLWSLPDGKFT